MRLVGSWKKFFCSRQNLSHPLLFASIIIWH
jgi:hypothetical protein